MRLIAAYAVLFAHSYALARGTPGTDPVSRVLRIWWGQGLGTLAVVIFFVISGFLISASYLHRENLFAFAEARFLRIFPALLVCVLFCVFVVGAWVTTIPVLEYLKHPGTWSYVWHNITLFPGVRFRLPGVFQDNPWPGGVNGSLWTLPIELYMYCMVMLIGALGILKHRASFNALALILLVALFALKKGWVPAEGIPIKHTALVMAYLAGVFFYVNREFIPLNMAVLLLVIATLLLFHGTVLWLIVQVFGLTYIVLFIALHPGVKLPNMDRYGDFSYGIYIYAFPVQQLVIKYMTEDPLAVLLYSTLIVFPLAMLSWRFIEKPALELKGRLPMGRRWLDPRVR